jgi:hypothetical protein
MRSSRPRARKPGACAQPTLNPAKFGVTAAGEERLGVDHWMCDAERVGKVISGAWARHLHSPRWRYLSRPSSTLAGALVLFCGDDLHPFDMEKPGFAHMSYGFAREVIVLAVRRSDRAILELVPNGERAFEQALCQAALRASDDALAAALSAQRWRLTDSYRGFLSTWFAHGFGMAAIQHAHMFHVLLHRTPEHRLPARREPLEHELARREVRLVRRARHQLLDLLDQGVVRAVRATGAILTPANYNFVATAPDRLGAQRRLEALAHSPGLLPALLGQDPPLPDADAADVLDYYRSGTDASFPPRAQALAELADQGRSLAPRIAELLGQSPALIAMLRAVPPIVFWRLGERSLRALLRTIDAVPPQRRPRTLKQWMALRHVSVAVNEVADAFARHAEELGQAVWSGAVARLLTWAAKCGWSNAVGAVWDDSQMSYMTAGIDRALAAELDVARALGISTESVLEELAKLTFPQVLMFNQKWQWGLEEHRRRVEQRSALAGE